MFDQFLCFLIILRLTNINPITGKWIPNYFKLFCNKRIDKISGIINDIVRN